MMYREVMFLCLLDAGVFGAEIDDVTQKPVMIGDSLTLPCNFTYSQEGDQINWFFGEHRPFKHIAHLRDHTPQYFNVNNVAVDNKNGTLTRKNMTHDDAGWYQAKMIIGGKEKHLDFKVTVHDPLPVPVIGQCSRKSIGRSPPTCVVHCLVNVSEGTLCWFKNSLSECTTGFNLSLEVDCQDNSTYSCVVSNSFTNQTKHLNISDLCQHTETFNWKMVVIVFAGVLAAVLVFLCCFFLCKKYRREDSTEDGTHRGENLQETLMMNVMVEERPSFTLQ